MRTCCSQVPCRRRSLGSHWLSHIHSMSPAFSSFSFCSSSHLILAISISLSRQRHELFSRRARNGMFRTRRNRERACRSYSFYVDGCNGRHSELISFFSPPPPTSSLLPSSSSSPLLPLPRLSSTAGTIIISGKRSIRDTTVAILRSLPL